MLESIFPNIIIDKLQIIMKGDGTLSDESKTIGNITGNTLGPNSNFQGDDINQVNIQITPELDAALTQLAIEIQSLKDTDEKDNASMYYDMLVTAIEQNKPNRIEKCLKTLNTILGTAASVATIAQEFSLIL